MRKTIAIQPKAHAQIKAIAKSKGIPFQRATDLILSWALPKFKAGEVDIVVTEEVQA